ncbi:MAG: DUF4129 domain-containing protein [Clostridia bacterium]|nr:DUF4129 domain-containing protein [Clostridia bacterium]
MNLNETAEYQLSGEWKSAVDYKPPAFDFAEDFIYFCIFYPAFILINRFFDRSPLLFAEAFLLLAAAFLMTLNRRKSTKVYIYLPVQVAIVAAMLLVPGTQPVRVTFTVCTAVAAAVSLKKAVDGIRRAEYKKDPSIQVSFRLFLSWGTSVWGCAILYATYMAALGFKDEGAVITCFFALPAMLAGYEIYIHRSGTYSLVEWKKDKNCSLERVRSFNRLFSVFIAAMAAIVAFLTYILIYFTGLDGVDQNILAFLLKDRKITTPELWKQLFSPHGGTDIKRLFGSSPTGVVPKILLIILTAFFWVLVAAVCAVVVIVLIRLIHGILMNLRKGMNGETHLALPPESPAARIRERLRSPARAAFIPGASNAVKIRRLYYRAVKRFRQKGVSIERSDSPPEIGGKIASRMKTDVSDATRVYEKARYSSEECTRKDLDLLRRRLK